MKTVIVVNLHTGAGVKCDIISLTKYRLRVAPVGNNFAFTMHRRQLDQTFTTEFGGMSLETLTIPTKGEGA